MGHAGRCVKITCNFTHPSAQTGHKVYPSGTYIYSYEADNMLVRREIEKHAKLKYAADNQIKAGWLGFVTTTDQMKFNLRADSDLKEIIRRY